MVDMRLLAFLFVESKYFPRTHMIYYLNESFSFDGVRPLTLPTVIPRLGTHAGRRSFMEDVAATLELEIERAPRVTKVLYTELAIFFLDMLQEHKEEVEEFWETLRHAPRSAKELASGNCAFFLA